MKSNTQDSSEQPFHVSHVDWDFFLLCEQKRRVFFELSVHELSFSFSLLSIYRWSASWWNDKAESFFKMTLWLSPDKCAITIPFLSYSEIFLPFSMIDLYGFTWVRLNWPALSLFQSMMCNYFPEHLTSHWSFSLVNLPTDLSHLLLLNPGKAQDSLTFDSIWLDQNS